MKKLKKILDDSLKNSPINVIEAYLVFLVSVVLFGFVLSHVHNEPLFIPMTLISFLLMLLVSLMRRILSALLELIAWVKDEEESSVKDVKSVAQGSPANHPKTDQ